MERAAHRLALPALRHAEKKKGKKSVDWKMAKKNHRHRHPNFKPADLPEFQIAACALAMLFDSGEFVTLDRDFQRYAQVGLNLQILSSTS